MYMDYWHSLTSLSHVEIQKLQNKKLQQFINQQVYPFSPHYRELFDRNHIDPRKIKSISDLRRIPFTVKGNLIDSNNSQKFKDYILQPDAEKIRSYWPKSRLLPMAICGLTKGKAFVKEILGREYRPVFMTFTTGTTNYPVPFMYSRYDIDNLNLSGGRMLGLFDIKDDERIMNLFPFAPHLAFWQVFFGALNSGVFALSTGGGKVMGTEGNMIAVMRIKPSVILGVPSYIYHLVRFAQEKGHDLSFVKKIILGAAKVTPAYKEKLAQMLASQGARDVSIFGTYGFTESRTAWAECPAGHHESSGYHLYPDKEIFEVIDPQTGEVKAEGEDGELVYTPLDSRASVVLRYRTGDVVKGGIVYGTCPFCKRPTLRMSSDISRLSDTKDVQLSKVKGTLVNFSHFGEVLNDIAAIDEWQIEICKKHNDPFEVDEFVIYVTPKKGADTTALAEEIRNKIIGATEISPNEIKFVSLSEIVKRLELETANKEKRILDMRPKV